LNSSLCQYDLRFRKANIYSPPRIQDFPKQKSRRNLNSTGSILAYQDYCNSSSIQLGFDVDLESGIIAAAQERDESHRPVQLFSLHGGHKLHSPYVSRPRPRGEDEDTTNVKCLKFATDIDGKMKSLYVGLSRDIQRYAWAEREEADAY
jgi:hypothetical protein